MAELDFSAFPWLLVFVALGPFLLFLPLLVELLKRKDRGPRPLPSPEEPPTNPPVGLPLAAPRLVRIQGDLETDGQGIRNHLVVEGSIALPAGVVVEGTIKASQGVEVGPGAAVMGDIIAGGNVTVGEEARVEGIIDAAGAVLLNRRCAVQAVVARGNTTLSEGVQVLKMIKAPIQVLAPEAAGSPRPEPEEPSYHSPTRPYVPPVEEAGELSLEFEAPGPQPFPPPPTARVFGPKRPQPPQEEAWTPSPVGDELLAPLPAPQPSILPEDEPEPQPSVHLQEASNLEPPITEGPEEDWTPRAAMAIPMPSARRKAAPKRSPTQSPPMIVMKFPGGGTRVHKQA
jgi:cytoskeletal protein CcmA (bactofilin family)